MLGIAILFVVFFYQCQGLAEQVPDTATIQNDPLKDKLASLLRDHEATTASLLREQEATTASLLREQGTVLADLTSLLQQQGEKLSYQEHLLHKQEQKMSYQDRSYRQLEQKVSDQEDILRHQDQKLSHLESLLQEQGARLSHKEALLFKQGRVILQLKNRHIPLQSFPSENLRHATDMSTSKQFLPGKISNSASHDVIPRSDDGGPLEAVVSHISQRVTEMGADILVFKTQTVNDINALKTQTSGDIQTLQNSNKQQDLAIQDAQSSTFVHWGSSTCSNLSHTVYSGVVGGAWYDHNGAATNYLCLTLKPVFSDHADLGGWVQYLYGGEYETQDSHQNKDAVCAVCRPSLSTTVMIPGTNVCTPGWHLQYSGFLMAGYHDHAAGSEYICVDSRLENNHHGDANEDGVLLFYTATICGSLPCTPYVNNKVVTCAVCSK